MSARTLQPPPDLSADKNHALALTPVSRETVARLERFVEMLLMWQRTTNLISPSTIPQLWTRHVADLLQLIDLSPNQRCWIDLGSGGGFPGLVVACALAEMPGAQVHLVESNMKKAAFLREAVRILDVPAVIHAARIEKFVADFHGQADVVTARALAPLKELLDQSAGLLKAGTVGIFPKGQHVDAELTEATRYWTFEPALVPSRVDPTGRIVIVRALEPRQQTP